MSGDRAEAANGRSQMPAISPDGRFVVYTAHATDLAAGDANDASDVFILDRAAGTTRLVSVNSAGQQGDADSFGSSVSADGRLVAFTSIASNLVPGVPGHQFNVYLRDLGRGRTELVSADGAGAPGNAMSFRAAISADGRCVAFNSAADLAPGGLPGVWDVYVRDLERGVTERASVGSGGAAGDGHCKGSAISADGRFVSFTSGAANLVERGGGRTDGVYIRDRAAAVTELVSVNSAGEPADAPALGAPMSADGRFVSFGSPAANLASGAAGAIPNIYLRDRLLGRTELVSADAAGRGADAPCHPMALVSGDGRFVVFASKAGNLAPGAARGRWDLFVRDVERGVTELLAPPAEGRRRSGESAADSVGAGISGDGRYVAFTSVATDLMPGSGARAAEVLLLDRRRGIVERIATPDPAVSAEAPPTAATTVDPRDSVILSSTAHGSVLGVRPDAKEKALLPRPAVEEAQDGGPGPHGPLLHNNRLLRFEAADRVAPPGGGPGQITARGRSRLEVPFFARNEAVFRDTSTAVAWLGDSPFTADKVIHTDRWLVEAWPVPAEVSDAPEGSVREAAGELCWRTESADTWYSGHTWDAVTFRARAGIIFRSRLSVTGVFQFGTAFFEITGEQQACT